MSDVVDLILQDHRELERLFDVLQNEPDKRPAMAPVMSTLLFAHSRAEESEVYPAAGSAGASDDVEHSQKEHLEADQLAEKLASTDPASPEFETALADLIKAVKHHMEEEEEKVLPAMREKMSGDQLQTLGEKFLSAREEQLGAQPDDLTREQMVQQADNADISGTSGLSKEELKSKLAEEAES
jgi:hemerythrin superfamily protein